MNPYRVVCTDKLERDTGVVDYPPLQDIVPGVAVTTIAVLLLATETVPEAVAEQPLASVTV